MHVLLARVTLAGDNVVGSGVRLCSHCRMRMRAAERQGESGQHGKKESSKPHDASPRGGTSHCPG